MSASDSKGYRDDFRAAEIAADWLVRLETEGAHCHAAFLEWVKQSPQHVREFLAVTQLSRRIAGVDAHRQFNIDALLASINLNVASLGESQRVPTSFRPAIRPVEHRASSARRRVGLGLGVAATLIGVTTGWPWLTLKVTGKSAYATALGEQRTVKLSDGSILHLNTQSRVQIHFSKEERRISLLRGEGLFVVAQEKARPFIVVSGDTTVTALGTQFNVRQENAGTIVSVMEGRVRIVESTPDDAPPSNTPQTLTAGEELHIAASGQEIKKTAVPETTLAWRQRRLVFQDDTLADVAAEFNRYNALQVRVEGNAIRNKLLTGAFNADNPQALVRFLGKDPSLTIEKSAEAVVIRAHQPGAKTY